MVLEMRGFMVPPPETSSSSSFSPLPSMALDGANTLKSRVRADGKKDKDLEPRFFFFGGEEIIGDEATEFGAEKTLGGAAKLSRNVPHSEMYHEQSRRATKRSDDESFHTAAVLTLSYELSVRLYLTTPSHHRIDALWSGGELANVCDGTVVEEACQQELRSNKFIRTKRFVHEHRFSESSEPDHHVVWNEFRSGTEMFFRLTFECDSTRSPSDL